MPEAQYQLLFSQERHLDLQKGRKTREEGYESQKEQERM
jgi:hypothetical protein